MTTKQNNVKADGNKVAATKIIELQVEVNLEEPTSTSKAGLKIWRGEGTTADGWRVFFQIYEPARVREKPNIKISLK